jgi:hypothetical protein
MQPSYQPAGNPTPRHPWHRSVYLPRRCFVRISDRPPVGGSAPMRLSVSVLLLGSRHWRSQGTSWRGWSLSSQLPPEAACPVYGTIARQLLEEPAGTWAAGSAASYGATVQWPLLPHSVRSTAATGLSAMGASTTRGVPPVATPSRLPGSHRWNEDRVRGCQIGNKGPILDSQQGTKVLFLMPNTTNSASYWSQ